MSGYNPFAGFKAGHTYSPAQRENQDIKKRFQNVMPVSVKQLLECKEDTLVIEGVRAQLVTVVGLVTSVKSTPTKFSITIDDQTGAIECLNYGDTNQEAKANQPTLLCERAYGRVVGSMKRDKNAKYLLIFQSFPVTDLNELNCHILEVIQTQISLKRLRETKDQNASSGTQTDNTNSNSMIKPGTSASTVTGSPNTASEGFKGLEPNQNLIHHIIASCKYEEGMHMNEIIDAAKNNMSKEEITNTVQFLTHEGLVFLTVDGDHYTANESQ